MKGLTAVRGGSEVSGVSLALGCYLLDHPEIAEEFRIAVETGRKILIDTARRHGFEALRCVTNFQLLRCPSGIDADDVARALKHRGYLVKSGFNHPSMRHCIRISVNGLDVMGPFAAALTAAIEEIGPAARRSDERTSA
jgi:histidinol-phosphate/aromatic aminotransferase/cobyric acid decarboxylase-like protein